MAGNLKKYREKRNFRKTAEPKGGAVQTKKKSKFPIFVIQKHAARAMHYDFRLEVGGVLKSWAVPKGPSMNPKERRLAMETEDHPMEYASFEGIIPKGEYGGGTVLVWDEGQYGNLRELGDQGKSMEQSYREGKIEIYVVGHKISGAFALVRGNNDTRSNQWYLIKMRDDEANADLDPVKDHPDSVLTGRSLEEIAAAADNVWSSNR